MWWPAFCQPLVGREWLLRKRLYCYEYLNHRLWTASNFDCGQFEVFFRVYALVVPRVWYRIIIDRVLLRIRVRSCVVVTVHVSCGHFAAVGSGVSGVRSEFF